ncbi:MAG: PAS domain-containing protein [Chitinivibrionales bacterium]|nr:PAS domain-containing protein [Chitinivibrionales bacterium]MBD3394529.1 PAS domain-containing protein [Chitinivibrionales bacterium]
MQIANILLVGVASSPLAKQLERYGYGVVSVLDTASIINVDTPYALMIVDQSLMRDFGPDAAERLYFMNNSVPTAVLIHDPAAIPDPLHRIILDGTFEPVYDHEVQSGFVCSKIDRLFITSQFNKNLKLHQRTFHEKEMLKKELSLREQILKQERVINTNIIGSITAGLIILDTEGLIVLVNEHGRELLDLGDIMGASYVQSLPGEIASVVEALSRETSTTLPHVIERCKIGQRFLEISAFRMLDYQNKPSGILVMVHDVTDQENASVQLYRAEKLATVGTMLSGIAHELRNPLSIISARAQRALASDRDEPARIRKAFESIEAQAQRCASIVNNLLDFTRQTATKAGYHKVADLLDETLTYVDYQNLFDDISVNKEYVPDLAVYGDRSRFVQIFVNLITNAAEAMEGRGTLTIRTRAADAHHTLIEINDTGPGIPPDIEPKIFDPFFTTKEPGKGTGLGLAIVFKIVQQSAGAISYTSRPGKTSFRVELPSAKERTHG